MLADDLRSGTHFRGRLIALAARSPKAVNFRGSEWIGVAGRYSEEVVWETVSVGGRGRFLGVSLAPSVHSPARLAVEVAFEDPETS